MQAFYLNSIFTLLVGFGFAFTVKAFQNGVRDFFSPLESVEKEWDKLIQKISGWKIDIVNLKASLHSEEKKLSTEDAVDETIKKIDVLQSNYIQLSSEYKKKKEKKQFTNNFSTLSLNSALFSIFMLVIAVFLRTYTIKDNHYGLYESFFYFEIFWILVISTLFIRDCLEQYNGKPLNKRWVVPLFIFFLGILTCHGFSNKNCWLDADNIKLVLFFSVLIAGLHYFLYFARTVILITQAEKEFRTQVTERLNPIIQEIETERKSYEIVNAFIKINIADNADDS